MSKDLDYFAEFLADPSKYSFDELHGWAKQWGRYLLEHKDEFNYLEDDEWKEIRERLLDALYDSEDQMDAVEEEWEEIGEMLENADKLTPREKIKLYERQIQFMKDYKMYFNFKEEDIKGLGIRLAKYVNSVREVELLEMQLQFKKLDYEKSIAELDDELAGYYERTGKIPKVTALKYVKKHRGN